MAVYGIPADPALVIPSVFDVSANILNDDRTLADRIRAKAAELTHAIAQAKQAGLSVDVLWRVEDDTAEITIVREY